MTVLDYNQQNKTNTHEYTDINKKLNKYKRMKIILMNKYRRREKQKNHH